MEFTNPLPFRHQREPHLPKPLQIPPATAPPNAADAADRMLPHPRSSSLPPERHPRPRTPLPPHKLASIANALGVSTPMPAALYRAPSPSGGAPFRTPSRYLLHVVPPAFLPADDDDAAGSDPEGAHSVPASAYRTQFRRGTLVPLYPTLQSQLGAIAREYGLPSTGGVVLYLMHSSQGSVPDGPRISDDVWRLLWHKALQAERRDAHGRAAAPLDLRSGRSTPASPFPARREPDPPSAGSSRSPSSPLPHPSPPSASTPSSDAAPFPLPAAPAPDLLADLTPNPFLPILAKVEFDIDRRKAAWFDAWAHGKRSRSRWRAGAGTLQLALPERAQSREGARADSSEYAVLDDGEGDRTAVDDDEQDPDPDPDPDPDQDTIVVRRADPLADVFGSDAATWRALQAGRQPKPKALAGLGISASQPELLIPPGDGGQEEPADDARDADEVVKLWDQNRRPTLPLNIPDLRRKGAPAPLVLAPSTDSLSSTSSLRLPAGNSSLPYMSTMSPLESDTGSSCSERNHDRKNRRRTGMVFGDLEVKIVAEPEEMSEADLSGPRSSQIIMKQKLDQIERQLAALSPRRFEGLPPPPISRPPEFDSESDRPLRSAPPNVSHFNITPPRQKGTTPINTSPPKQNAPIAKPPMSAQTELFHIPPRKDSLIAPRVRRHKEHKRGQSSQSSSGSSSKNQLEPPAGGAARQGGSYAPLGKPQPPIPGSPAPPSSNTRLQDRSPPQLTLKRASGVRKPVPGDLFEEKPAREADSGQDVLLSPTPHSIDSPVIPLSPDPFGKRPVEDMRQPRRSDESSRSASNGSQPPSRGQGTVLPAAVPEDAEVDAQSSRFSLDSEQGVEQLMRQSRSRSNSIMSVRSLRNLWRKSGAPNKAPGGAPLPPLPTPGDLSPQGSLLSQGQPPSQHSRGESSASQRSTRSSERSHRPTTAPRPDSGSDPFQFDNANIFKSHSSTNLASSVAPLAPNHAAPVAGGGQARGILKGWNGTAKPPDADARQARRPSVVALRRSMSTTSTTPSDAGDHSRDAPSSPPPSTPPDLRRGAARKPPSVEPAPVMMLSHSAPTSSVLGFSRYPDSLPAAAPLPPVSPDDRSTRSTGFEMISPPRRPAGLAPTASYHGDISH